MQTQQAKHLSFPDLLARLGYQPTYTRGNKLWYHSPLHTEQSASFCVEPGRQVAWVFSDHGIQVKGTILDFAMHHEHCSLTQALCWLDQIFAGAPLPSVASTQSQPVSNQSLQVRFFQSIQHPGLKAYVRRRAIPLNLADRYLWEVHYLNAGQARFALGWQTNVAGWCLRAPNFKACIRPAGVTIIGKSGTRLAVFEGMFDFLSALAYYRAEGPQGQVMILNGVAHLHTAIAFIGERDYQFIKLYLDTDPAGREATQQLLKLNQTVDCSSIFSPAKDFAQWYEAGAPSQPSFSFPQ